MPPDKPKTDFSVYLAKEGIDDPVQPVKQPESLKRFDLELTHDCHAVLFVRHATKNPPRWSPFFQGFVDLAEFGQNSSTGAVLSLPVGERIVLVTFGQGWHCVDSMYIESNFGLKVALNALDPKSIRSIDRSSLEAQPRQLREQSGRATEIQYFGIDIERDLLRAVTGTPKADGLGSRISGMDAVRLSLEVDLVALPETLENILVAYRSDEYKSGPFSWIDHIGQIRDRALCAELDHNLLAKLNAKEFDAIWLNVPEIIDWNRVAGFRYSMSRRAPRVYDIRIPEFLEFLNKDEITLTDLTRRKIACVDSEDLPVLERPAYQFVYAELATDDGIYLLNNGKWYRVQDDYVATVNASFAAISPYDGKLPEYADETEGDYNKRVAAANADEFVLLDTDLVYLPGAASPVEACDLYRKNREFIHVKRYGGSSVLSHLFNQGLVSGELFQMDNRYRELVDEKLPVDQKIDNTSKRPGPHEYRIVYAVISESDDPLVIPFFSKISLKHCMSRLEAMGFDVMLAKVSVAEKTKRLKKYAPAPNKI